MVQEFEQADIFGHIGRGLGAGFGEAIEKGAEGANLSRAIQEATAKGQSGTGLGIVQALARRGIPADQIAQLSPLIKEELRLRGGQSTGDGSTGGGSNKVDGIVTGISDPSTGTNVPDVGGRVDTGGKLLDKPQPIDGGTPNLRSRMSLSESQIIEAGRQLARDNPADFTVDQGIDSVRKRIESEENRVTLGIDEMNRRLNELLQQTKGGKDFKDIPGDTFAKTEDLLEDAILRGRDPINAGRGAARELLDFAKERNSLFETGARAIMTKPSPKTISDIKSTTAAYAKVGAQDQQIADLRSLGYEDFFAHSIVYPISERMESAVNAITPITPKDTLAQTKASKAKIDKSNKQYGDFLENIASLWSTDNSIYTDALAINEIGHDEMAYYDAVRQASNQGQIELTPRQQRELTGADAVTFSLADILLSAWAFPIGASALAVPTATTPRTTLYSKIRRSLGVR